MGYGKALSTFNKDQSNLTKYSVWSRFRNLNSDYLDIKCKDLWDLPLCNLNNRFLNNERLHKLIDNQEGCQINRSVKNIQARLKHNELGKDRTIGFGSQTPMFDAELQQNYCYLKSKTID